MGGGSLVHSSSSDEDGDAEWRAAIDSIASVKFDLSQSNGAATRNSRCTHADDSSSQKPGLKLYQIKAQKLLDEYLQKNLEIVRMLDPPDVNQGSSPDGGVVQLFSRAPPGIKLETDTKFVQNKRPKILPGEEINEKSKKFKHQISSVTVDGAQVITLAEKACEKSLARYKTKEAAAKEKAKREEERVSELKKIRGETWLPSVAKHMQEEARRQIRSNAELFSSQQIKEANYQVTSC